MVKIKYQFGIQQYIRRKSYRPNQNKSKDKAGLRNKTRLLQSAPTEKLRIKEKFFSKAKLVQMEWSRIANLHSLWLHIVFLLCLPGWKPMV